MKNLFYPMLLIIVVALLSLAACGGGAERLPQEAAAAGNGDASAQAVAGDAAKGKELFTQTCSACHGPNGEGVQGLGKDMTASTFIAEQSDEELVTFIKVGRDPSHPLNSTGVAMPPKGGNPALSEADLVDLVAFIRSIHQ